MPRRHAFACGTPVSSHVPSGAIAFLVSGIPSIHEAGDRARARRRARPAHPRLRLRHRIESGDARPARTRVRLRPDARRSALRARARPSRGAGEHRGDSIRERHVRPGHVVRRVPMPARAGRTLGDRRDGARAQARRQRCCCTSPRSRSCTANIRCCRKKCGATRRRACGRSSSRAAFGSSA